MHTASPFFSEQCFVPTVGMGRWLDEVILVFFSKPYDSMNVFDLVAICV